LKIPTPLEFDIAETHAKNQLRLGKRQELCSCRTCTYVQEFLKRQILARMSQSCQECGEPCEEEE